MKLNKLFSLIVRYFSFLKFIPGLPHVFDHLIRVWLFFVNPGLLDLTDEIESDVMSREGASVGLHKYGGLQFNYYGKEIGHLHSNGLLDILFDRKVKQELLLEGKINHHHVFKNSGWISFYIQDAGDMNYAKELLSIAYEK